MENILNGFFTLLVPIFLMLVHFWYISVPVIALLIIFYIKWNNESARRVIRIVFAFIIISIIFTGIYMIKN